MSSNPYRGFRYPAEVIEHAVWLYHCFSLSLREVELILASRGVAVTYDTNPRKCGLVCARGWRGGRARNQSLIPARHLSDRANELAGWY